MPLYALDEKNKIIAARDADPFRRYRCLECRLLLQKRSGRERRPHFSHLRAAPQCRLYSRSIDHLALQTLLKEQIPSLELERPFADILRIADLCWEERKLIFEIQCSPIHPTEVMQRNADYASSGYELVWLLDDRLYNKRSPRLSELELRATSCYYFTLKTAEIYDQYEIWLNEKRLDRGPPLPVDLSNPIDLPAILPSPLTKQLEQRRASRLFSGDLFFRILRYEGYLKRLVEHEETLLKNQRPASLALESAKRGFYEGIEQLLRQASDGDELESEVESGVNREP